MIDLVERIKMSFVPFWWAFTNPKNLFAYIRNSSISKIHTGIAFVGITVILMYNNSIFSLLKQYSYPQLIHFFSIILFFFLAGLLISLYLSIKAVFILLILKLFKEKVKFKMLFIAFFYCMFPSSLIFGIIILIFPHLMRNFFFTLATTVSSIWDSILTIVALSVLFDFSYKRSFFIVMIWLLMSYLVGSFLFSGMGIMSIR